MLSSLKNETDASEQSFHSMSSSLKNEISPDHHITPSNQTSLNVPHVLLVPSPSSSYLLPIIGKMGGMALVYGYHNGAKPLAFR